MNGNGTGPFLSHLPGVYHSSADLRELLSGLEEVFFAPDERSFERQITHLASYLDAAETPDEFLPWLGEWVALSFKNGLSPALRRRLIAEIVPLYAKRGTKSYLTKLLELFSPQGSLIRIEDDESPGLIVGNARIGVDSWLERDRPFHFKVTVRAPRSSVGGGVPPRLEKEWQDQARRVIDLAKPAHTVYELDWAFGALAEQSFEFRRRETLVREGNDDC